MRIVGTSVSVLKLPLERSHVGASGRRTDAYRIVLARVRTGGGVEGIGYFVSQRSELVGAVAAAARELGEVLHGLDVLDTAAGWERMARHGRWLGPGGLLHFAIAPLDVAVWDAAGKVLGRPLHRLLGGSRDRVRAYATDGFTQDRSIDDLEKAALAARAAGFTGLKFRTGPHRRPNEEVERYRALRAAAGPEALILVEAGQSWDLARALQTGRALQEAGAHWIEDPLYHRDFDGLARLVASLSIPIAAGENLYALDDFRRFFRERAVGIPIVDLGRIGGITPWMRVASLAYAHGLPICGHVLSEIHVHLLAAAPNGYLLEYAPRAAPILKNPPRLENGALVAPASPGLGLELDEEAVRRFTDG